MYKKQRNIFKKGCTMKPINSACKCFRAISFKERPSSFPPFPME